MDILQPIYDTLQKMVSGIAGRLPYFVVALLLFGLTLLLARGVGKATYRLMSLSGRRHNLALVLGRLLQSLVVFVGLLVALVVVFPSFTPGQLVELLGVGGVAIGFAFRDVLQNFLAGILLLITEPFKIGDQVIVGQFEGTVEEIFTRATVLRTYDNRQVVIPNSSLFTDSVIVNTAYPVRRCEYDVGISYHDSVEQAEELILAALNELPSVRQDPAPEVLLMAFGDSAVILRVRWWIDPPRRRDALSTHNQALRAIRRTFNEHGITIPFPTRTVLLPAALRNEPA